MPAINHDTQDNPGQANLILALREMTEAFSRTRVKDLKRGRPCIQENSLPRGTIHNYLLCSIIFHVHFSHWYLGSWDWNVFCGREKSHACQGKLDTLLFQFQFFFLFYYSLPEASILETSLITTGEFNMLTLLGLCCVFLRTQYLPSSDSGILAMCPWSQSLFM